MNSSLNRMFKVIWSKAQGAWVAVSEIVRAHGKEQSLTRITRKFAVATVMSGGAAIAAPPAPNQLPTGGQIAAGVASMMTNGNTMTVTQSSNRASINWNTFDIGSQATVNFVQPSANAVALNRVNSPNPSQIFGNLNANGQVYLLNSAGVYFAPGAQVNVGGIVATTHSMSDAAFMAGSTTFNRNGSTGQVVNEGTIQTSLNGYIAMLAPEVRNAGLLVAQSGTIALAGGEAITLNFGPASKLESIAVTASQIDTLVENRHAIKAPNGLVILSARAMNQLAATVINSGTIEAKGVSQQGGRIILEGSSVTNTGTLDVSSDTAQAGTITINGKTVSISGRVIATSPVQGGALKVQATQTLNVNANIDVSSAQRGGQVQIAGGQVAVENTNINADGDTHGGEVRVEATNAQNTNPFSDPFNPPSLPLTMALTGYTSISSRSRRGQGGNATILGDSITLDGNTTVNVSGATGGGNVLVGGDWQGSNGIYQATTTYMGQNVTIDASATLVGDGGKVVLWSDLTKVNGWTLVSGTINALGANGTGGQVETSGRYLGIDNTAAVSTGGGLWLLDPADITISTVSSSGIRPDSVGLFGADYWVNHMIVNNGTVINALNNGTNVKIYTSDFSSERPGSAVGNINIYADIIKTDGNAVNLTFEANAAIYGPGNIGSTGNRLNLTFNSTARVGTYSGSITGNVALTKLGTGTIALTGANTYTGPTVVEAANSLVTQLAAGSGSNTANYTMLATDMPLYSDQKVIVGDYTLHMQGDGNLVLYKNLGKPGQSALWSTGTSLAGSYAVIQSDGNLVIYNPDGRGFSWALNSSYGHYGAGLIIGNNGQFYVGYAGTLRTQSNSALGNSQSLTVNGTLNMWNSVSTGTLNGSGTIGNWGSPNGLTTLTFGNSDEILARQFSGALLNVVGSGGVLGITKTGSGNWTLAGSTAYTGATNIQCGTLAIYADTPITSSSGFYGPGKLNITGYGSSEFSSSGWTFGANLSGLDINTGSQNLTIASGYGANIAGPIVLTGRNIALNANVSSTLSGADVSFKARNNISQAEFVNVTTNGGNASYWANSWDNTAGYILLNGGSGVGTSGGNIILGGGLGSSPLDGYAKGTTDTQFTNGISLTGNNRLISGGGAITLRGMSSNTSNVSVIDSGVNLASGSLINAGIGKVSITGIGLGSGIYTNVQGVTISGLTVISANTSSDAISIIGSTADVVSAGTSLGINGGSLVVEATGSGGGIIINGTSCGTGVGYEHGLDLSGASLLAASGPILVTSTNSNSGNSSNYANAYINNSYFGSKASTNVTSSTANVTLRANEFTFVGSSAISTSGNLSIESLDNAFASGHSISGLTFSSDLGGLTVGKTTNNQDLVISDAINISGPISLYGKDITLSANLTTTGAAGNILLKATNHIYQRADIRTNGASVIYWSDSNADRYGSITVNGTSSSAVRNIITNGGGVWMGGGNGTASWTPYAGAASITVGNGTASSTVGNEIGVRLILTNISTGNGTVYIAGTSNQTSGSTGSNGGIELLGTNIQTSAGDIQLSGSLQGKYTNGTALVVNATSVLQTGSGNITLTGNTSDISGSTTGWRNGLGIAGGLVKTVTGNISLTGNSNTSYSGADSSAFYITDGSRVVSQTGAISIIGNNNASGYYDDGIRIQNNNFTIGYDGTNAYSGDITIQSDRISQRTSTAGTINVRTTGNLSILSTNASFTRLWVEDSSPGSAMTFGNSWNFGTSLGSFTLGKTSNTYNYTFANALTTAGNISLYGGNITLGSNLTSTGANSRMQIKALGSISSNADNLTFKTNNGSMVFWSNANSTSGGGIAMGNANLTFNTANGNTNQVTGGGNLVFGGGAAVDANGNPTGSAVSAGNGIVFNPGSSGNTITKMYTGGGNISLNAKSTGGYGIMFNRATLINAGNGSLNIQTNATSVGIEFNAYGGATSGTSITAQGITINGSSSGSAAVYIANNGAEFTSTGSGNIDVKGVSAPAAGHYGIMFGSGSTSLFNLTTASGDITLNGTGNSTALSYYLGNIKSTAGGNISIIANSPAWAGYYQPYTVNYSTTTGNISINAISTGGGYDAVQLSGGNFSTTTGNISIVGRQSGAKSGVSFQTNVTNISTAGGSVTVDGTSNTSAIGLNFYNSTVNINTSGAGAINLYGSSASSYGLYTGGAVNLTTTGSGAVSVCGTSTSSYGIYTAAAFNVNTSQGSGGITVCGTTNSSLATYISQNFNLVSGAGNINLTGATNSTSNQGVYIYSGNITTTSGNINLSGTSNTGYSGFDYARDTSIGSISSTTGNITISGSTNANGFGVDLYGNVSSTTGDISITGNGGSSTYGLYLNKNVTSTSGNITLTGRGTGSYGLYAAGTNISSAGNISLFSESVMRLNSNVYSTGAGNKLVIKSNGSIHNTPASQTIQTNNGTLVLWSNANGSSSAGRILFDNTVATLNTANGSTSQTSGGGNIIIGGGSAVDGNGNPTGAVQYSGDWAVSFGGGSSGSGQIYSGGGDISIKGNASGGNAVLVGRNSIINAGNGSINIAGCGTYSGVYLNVWNGGAYNITAKGDIIITGSTSGSGTYDFDYSGIRSYYDNITQGGTIRSTGGNVTLTGSGKQAGLYINNNNNIISDVGNVTLTGTANSGSRGIVMYGNVLGGGSDINISTTNNNSIYLAGNVGQRASTNVTSTNANITISGSQLFDGQTVTLNTQTGNITLRMNTASWAGLTLGTNGSIAVLPLSDSAGFGHNFNVNWFGFNPTINGTAYTPTAFTIGNSYNTYNITWDGARTVGGPISLYGANVAINAGMTTNNATTGNIGIYGNLSGAGNIAVATGRTITVSQSGASTYSGCISGSSAQLIKAGAGALTLSGANTYNGSTNITAGTLIVTGSLSDTTAVNVSSGATYNASSSDTIGSFSGAGIINLISGTLTAFGDNSNATYSGNLSGAGGFAKAGTGTIIFTGNNTYLGATTVNAGTLTIGGGGSLGSGTYAGAIVNNASFIYNSTVAQTLSGNISGTGALTQSGSGNLTLTGSNNTYSGDTYIGIASNLLIGTNSANGRLGNGTYAGNITNNGALFFNSTANQTLSGVISGSGNVTLQTASNLTLSGSNSYSGVTTVNAGSLLVSADGNLGGAPGSATAGSLVLNGGTLRATANFTLNSNRGITLGSSNGTFTIDPSVSVNYAGVIAGTGSMTKSGSGTLVMSGSNSYSGSTNVTAGTLQIGAGGTSGSVNASSNLNISSGTTLAFNRSDDVSVVNNISGAGAVVKSASNTLTLTGLQTYTGSTNVTSGAIVFTNNATPTTSGFTGAGAVTIQPNGSAFTNAFNTTNYTYATTLTGLTIGNSTSVANKDITVNGTAINISGSIKLYGGNIALNTNLITTAAGTGNITLAAAGTILTNTSGLAFTTNGSSILFAADTDNSGAGAISLDRVSLTSSGGDITLGGGAIDGSGYAVGANVALLNGMTPNYRGIWLHSSSVNAGGGNITVRGKGATPTATGFYGIGVDIVSFGYMSGTGDVVQTSGNGSISIVGIGGANNDAGAHPAGINIYSDSGIHRISTVNGSITFNGTAGTGTARTFGGIQIDGGTANITSTRGDVEFIGIANASGYGISNTGTLNLGGDGTTNSSGNITLTADVFNTGGTYNIRNTGNVTIQSNGSSFGSAFDWNSRFTLTGNKAGLTIGKATNTQNVTVSTDTSVAGPINIYGGNIAVNSGLTTSNTTTGNISLVGNVSGAANIALASGRTLTVNQSGVSTYSGCISGTTAQLIKAGAGTLTLSGTNTYNGTTNVTAGSLIVTGSLSDSTVVNVSSGASYNVSSNDTIAAFAGCGTINLASAKFLTAFGDNSSTTFAGVIAGAGGFIKAGSGNLTLSNTNTYTGNTTISAGALLIGGSGTLGSGSYAGNISNNGSFIYTSSSNQTLSGVMSGSGSLTHNASSTLTLTGANTFTGGANISAGKVIAGNSNPSSSFDDNLAVYVNDGAIYQLGGSEVIGQLTGAGSIILGSHRLTAYTGGTSGTFSGVISGTGHFAVAANASATLTGNNTYTGETLLATNATLTLGSGGTSGSVANSSLIGFADGSTLRLNRSDDLTIASNLYKTAGTNYLIKDGAGNLTLTSTNAQNTFAGRVTVNAGSLIVAGNLGAASSVTVQNNDATVIYNSSVNQSLSVLNGTGTFQKLGTGALLLTTSSGFTGDTTVTGGTLDLRNTVIGGNITNNADVLFNSWVNGTYSKVISGTGNVTISGADLTYTGDNTYTGATINYGTLRIGANGTTGSVVADGGITNTGNVYFNRSDNPTYAGVISGSGHVRLMNSTTFTGNNTYTGETLLATNATLTLGSGGTSGSVANSSLISFADGATLRLNRSDDLTIASSIYRAGGTNYLIKDGAGNVTLTSTSGQNTFAGTVTVNAGSLIVQGALGASSAVAVQNNNATVIYNSSSNQSLATLNGTGSFQKLGTGALLLTTSSGFTGNTTVTGGTLDLRNTVIGGNITNNADVLFNSWVSGTYSKVISGTGNVTISGADVTYTGDNTYTGATINYGTLRIGANGTTGSVVADGGITNTGNVYFNRSDNPTYAGVISGSGNVRLMNSTTFTGNSTYTGETILAANATLTLGANGTSGSVANSSLISFADGATLRLNRSDDLTIASSIYRAGGTNYLIKDGAGNVTLTSTSGQNTFAGTVTVNDGSLIVKGALGASSAVAVQNNNATVIYNSSSNQSLATLNGTGSFQKLGTGALLLTTSSGFTGDTTVTGGTLDLRNTVIGGNITNNADVLFNSWVSGTYSKVISGTGNVTISGADVTYTGENTYTGATTIYGILRVGANGTIGNLASSNISGSGTLTFNRSNAVEYAGNISGTVEVKKYGNGTLSLTGTNTQTTAVNVYAGALQIGNGSTAGSLTSNIILSSGAAAIFNRSDDLQYGGNISGTGAMLTQLGSGTLTLTGLSTYTGATNVSAGSIIFTNNARPSTSGFTGTGNVTITPAGSAFTSAFSTGSYTYANTLGSLTIGNASSSANANITVNAALGIAGNINLYGGNIAVNSALTTAGSSIIRLAAASNGNITQGASGNITTSGLALLGGNANLTNVNNSVSTLAAQDVANMSFVNTGNLIIGAVNPTGVDVTGTINITAQSGNISLTEALATTSNASNAIVLNAGAGTAAGTATGGNILISGNGSVSVGSGGRATLFTGSIANSTGLTNLVGSGSGNFRYNSNASSTGYNSTAAALGAGTYAVYREAPELGLTADSGSMTYGGTTPTLSYTVSGDQNGDTIAQIFASAPSVAIGGNSTAAGYVAGNHSVNLTTSAGLLGYNITVTNGNLVVGKIVLNTNGTTVVSRAYDGTVDATLTNTMASGILASDLSNVTLNLAGIFADKNVANNISVTSNISMTGSASDNYSFTQPIGLTGDITPKTVILSAAQAYSGSNTLTNVTVATGISGETLTYSAALANSANVVDNGSNYITSITLGSQAGANTTSGGLVSNYQLPTLNVSNAPVTISAANLTVAANNQTRAYGATNPSTGNVTITSGQLYSTDALGTAEVTTTANATSNVGNYTLTASNQSFASGLSSNYNITYNNGTLTVNPADLTITANSASTQYGLGTTLGNTAFTSSGLQNSETIGTVVLASAGSANTTNVGTYNITASGAANGSFTASNYNISYVNGSLVVTQANITVVADDQSRTYGAANPTSGTVTLAGGGTLYNGDTLGNATVASAANATSNVGNYTLTASNQTMSTGLVGNYNITYATGNLTVNPADLTITANSTTKSYGVNTNLTAVGYVSNGLMNSETIGDVTLASAGAANTSSVATYNIAVSNASGGTFNISNYNITYNNGTLTVNPADLTITANSASTQYGLGTTLGNTAFTSSGLQNSETIGTVVLASAGSANTTNVGTYNITASGAANGSFTASNYNISYVNGSLVVTQANLTLAADDQARTYGAANPTAGNVTITSGQLYNSDALSTATVTSAANATSNVGNYTLTASNQTMSTGLVGNYNITYATGNLTVNPADLTITANSASTQYGLGTTLGNTAFTSSGLQNSETIGTVVLASAGSANTTNVGTYNITASGAANGSFTASNYNISYVNGSLVVTQANITVVADDQSRTYGAANPTSGTVTLAGGGTLYNGDTLGNATLASTANATSNVGNYTLTASNQSFTSGLSSNYNITYNNGTLTVNPADLTITANSASTQYGLGTTLGNTAFTSSGLQNSETIGTVVLASAGSANTTNVGTYNITASGAANGSFTASNYNISYVNGSLVVTQANLTLAADDQARTYGAANPTAGNVTITSGQLYNSDALSTATVTSAANATSNVGNYTLTASNQTMSTGLVGNYNITYATGNLTVNPADLTITANSASTQYGLGTTLGNTAFTSSGLQNSETIGTVVLASAGSANTTNVGTYNITASGAANGSFTASNYNISYVNGSLVVTQANITVVADDQSRTYGAANPTSGTVTLAGGGTLYNGDTLGNATLASTANATSNVGNYTLTASNQSFISGLSSNYNITYNNGTLTVNKAEATVIANSANVTYNGSQQSVSGFTATGLVNNQTVAVLTDVSAGANGTNAGVYVSQATGNATNYNLTFVDGALTIDKAALTVTGNTFNTTYTGQSQSVSGYNVSGLQGADTVAVLNNVSASGANGTNAGSYTNSVTTGVETNYIVTGINGALNIAKAVITVSADNKARLYGDSNPSLTQAMTGFVVGEDAVIANITGSSAASTLATNLSGVGNYTITSGIGNLSAANYDFAASNGTLTINKAHLTVTADDQSRIYGAANPTFTQTITGFVNGETSSVVSGSAFGSSVANATTSVGNHTITAGLSGLSSANYDFVGANGTLTISKAQLSAIGNKVYDGSSLINGSQISVTGVNGETFTATGTAAMQSKNVQTNQSLSSIAGLALSGANGSSLSNYEDLVLPNTSVSVSRLNVTLVAPNATMVYGNTTIQQATTADLTALSGQLVGGDRVSSAAITYNTKDAGANKTVTLNSVVVSDDNGGQNYCVSVADSYNGVITKAPLIISAVNDGKILAQADTVAANGSIGYGGVVYTGFVGGETAANLTSTANGSVQALWNGTVTRSNISGVDNQSARTYSGVLTPSSFSATNYNITYRAGDYIIVPADTLLIKVVGSGTANVNYSSSLSSFQLSAEYVRSNTTISNLSANVTNGYASIVDGFGTTAIFRLNAVNGSYSSSGNLNVGGYNLDASNVTIIGSNFNNLAVVGAITVAPKTINNNVSTIQSVSKVYDGSTSITAANLSFNQTASGVVAGDHVSLIGSGSYTDRHVGANKSVTLSMGLFGNEFGNDSNNYVLSNASLTGNIGTITQLASVAYTGANNGNWSTATNWAGGALPDGNNVAQVIIPINKTVVYNSEQVGTTSSAIVNNGSIVFDSANAFNLANSISGTGSIVQRGAGILNITGNNSMSGVVDIANYRLSLGSQNALGNANITSTGGNLSVTGGTTLSRLSVDGAVTIDSVINTIGDQVYGGPLTFMTGNNSSTANFNSSSGNISFMSTVSAGAGSKSAQRNLVVTAANGTVLFNDQVGLDVVDRLSASYTLNPYTSSYSGLSGVNPYAMNVTAQTIKLFGDVTTFEGQEYNSSVLIGDNGSNGRTRLLLSMDPSVVVNGTINDVSAGQHTLLMRAFSLLANVGPAPTIRYGNVGNIAPLADLNALVGVQETNPALSPVVGQQAAGVPLFGSVTQTGTTTIYVAPLPQSSMGSNTASQNGSMHGQLHDQTQQLVQSFKSSEMDSSASAGDVVVGDLTNASCDPKIDDFCSGK